MKVDFIQGGADSPTEEKQESNFLSKKRFSKMVEDTVRKMSMSYMDAVVYLCDENTIEIDDVKKYLSVSIKERIEGEAMNLNYLEKSHPLPTT
jgi:tryptophanyl-tRNA synthetase|tara:strand:+ start:150 stop:428 length:279 start_codon:yes stop_codon:yes gene_type:complete